MKAKDLAKELGVSPATVSLVLNNKPGLSESLRASLIQRIQELGCGDMLKSGQVREGAPVIAYLSYLDCDADWDTSGFFFPGVMEGAESEAREHGCSLSVLHMRCEGDVPLPELLRRCGNVAGVIVQSSASEEILCDLREVELPCVFMDSYAPELNVSSVNVDNRQTMYNTVKYLKEKGHREIGYVSSGWTSDYCLDRRLAFRRAVAMHGLRERQEFYFNAGWDDFNNDGRALRKSFSEAECLPTALVCEGDGVAVRSVQALQGLGMRVPEDVSVVGFDNSPLCAVVEPQLTSVRNSRHLMGREAVMLLLNLRRLREAGVPAQRLKYLLPTELVERGSVADRNPN